MEFYYMSNSWHAHKYRYDFFNSNYMDIQWMSQQTVSSIKFVVQAPWHTGQAVCMPNICTCTTMMHMLLTNGNEQGVLGWEYVHIAPVPVAAKVACEVWGNSIEVKVEADRVVRGLLVPHGPADCFIDASAQKVLSFFRASELMFTLFNCRSINKQGCKITITFRL